MGTVQIIDTIATVPLGLLQPMLDTNGPFTGNNIRDTWGHGGVTYNIADSFGCILQVSGAIAPHLGRTFGVDDGGAIVLDQFEDRIVQAAAIHQLFGGSYVASQVVDCFYLPTLIRWAETLPGRLGLYVSPTWAVDVYFLRAL